jgi:hypothetical protein
MGAAGDNLVQASSFATLASGSAILFLPLILGRLADGFGIRAAYSVVIVILVKIFLVVQFASRWSQSPNK